MSEASQILRMGGVTYWQVGLSVADTDRRLKPADLCEAGREAMKFQLLNEL